MITISRLAAKTFRVVYRAKVKQFDGIPGPQPTFPLGTMRDFLVKKQPWEVCGEYAAKFGPMTLIWFFGKPAVVLNDPHLIGEVLVTNTAAFYKKDPCKALAPIITPNSSFLANDPDWKDVRSREPFRIVDVDQWLEGQVEPLRSVIQRHATQIISRPKSVDLYQACQRLAFDAFNVASCGEPLGDAAYDDFMTMAKAGTKRMQSPLPIPAEPRSRRFRSARQRWSATHELVVRRARNHDDRDRPDLLAVMLKSNSRLPDDLLRDVIADLPFGGVFSVSSAVATAIYLLNRHPDVASRLEAEVKPLFDRADFQLADLEACEYLGCVLRETLRYLTPVPMFFRNVQPDRAVELGGVTIPPDTMLVLTSWALHRSAGHWQDADRFDPDRWASGGAEANPLGSDYFFPFGRGPRSCPGTAFAMFYMKLALATLLSRMRIEIESGQAYKSSFFFGVMVPQLKGRCEAR